MELYHASPFDFDIFDLSKIGTGSEKSRYGYGFYFSTDFNDALTHGKNETLNKGIVYLYTVRLFSSLQIVELDGECPFVYEIAKKIQNKYSQDAKELINEYEEYGMTNREVYDYLIAIKDKKYASKIFEKSGIHGILIPDSGWYNGDVYLIFSPDSFKIINKQKFAKQ